MKSYKDKTKPKGKLTVQEFLKDRILSITEEDKQIVKDDIIKDINEHVNENEKEDCLEIIQSIFNDEQSLDINTIKTKLNCQNEGESEEIEDSKEKNEFDVVESNSNVNDNNTETKLVELSKTFPTLNNPNRINLKDLDLLTKDIPVNKIKFAFDLNVKKPIQIIKKEAIIKDDKENDEMELLQEEKKDEIVFEKQVSIIKPQNNFDTFFSKKEIEIEKEKNKEKEEHYNIQSEENTKQQKKNNKQNQNEQINKGLNIVFPVNPKRAILTFEDTSPSNTTYEKSLISQDKINTSKVNKNDYFSTIFHTISAKKSISNLYDKINKVNDNHPCSTKINISPPSSSFSNSKMPIEVKEKEKYSKQREVPIQKSLILEKIKQEHNNLINSHKKQKGEKNKSKEIFSLNNQKDKKESTDEAKNVKKKKVKKNGFDEIDEQLEIIIVKTKMKNKETIEQLVNQQQNEEIVEQNQVQRDENEEDNGEEENMEVDNAEEEKIEEDNGEEEQQKISQ